MVLKEIGHFSFLFSLKGIRLEDKIKFVGLIILIHFNTSLITGKTFENLITIL